MHATARRQREIPPARKPRGTTVWRPLGCPFGEKAKSDGTETAYGHGMRPGHSGSPALSTLPTAWRAPIRGAPVTAEGWGPITPPKGEKATRHHTLADRTHEQWTTDPSTTVDSPAQPGIPPGKTLRTRDGGIGIPPVGSDRSTAISHNNGWRDDNGRFH